MTPNDWQGKEKSSDCDEHQGGERHVLRNRAIASPRHDDRQDQSDNERREDYDKRRPHRG